MEFNVIIIKVGCLATEHLIECGCKRIVHFSGVIDEEMPADNKRKGFYRCM